MLVRNRAERAELAVLYVRNAEHGSWIRIGSHSRLDPLAPPELSRGRLIDLAAQRREPWPLGFADYETPDEDSASSASLSSWERSLVIPGPTLLLPLIVSDRCVGIAVLRYPRGTRRAALEPEFTMLGHLGGQAAISLENAQLYRLAVADPETGLYVESFFRSRFAEEVDRAQRRRSRLALLAVPARHLAEHRLGVEVQPADPRAAQDAEGVDIALQQLSIVGALRIRQFPDRARTVLGAHRRNHCQQENQENLHVWTEDGGEGSLPRTRLCRKFPFAGENAATNAHLLAFRLPYHPPTKVELLARGWSLRRSLLICADRAMR